MLGACEFGSGQGSSCAQSMAYGACLCGLAALSIRLPQLIRAPRLSRTPCEASETCHGCRKTGIWPKEQTAQPVPTRAEGKCSAEGRHDSMVARQFAAA